ncbi:class I SAM-dependent methyltransferase [Reichenbachiella sp. MALMAid0571]|uniref:class I SAM-dependent methyltransferase n=1 Tax=Reichenbachiella sp. MALMAid0571 TaxID=3143939 RepID=UPI0032E047EE
MKTNDFDLVAPYYDRLAQFVFGDTIHKAQIEFLHLLDSASKILILGGGTGWILQELIERKKGAEIFYVEKSSKMIELARSQFDSKSRLNIHFIHSPFEDWKSEMDFDVVICNFFLDVFTQEKLNGCILPRLKSLLSPEGRLIVTDFQNKQNLFWQRLLLWVMHVFFGKVSRLESSKLTDLSTSLNPAGFVLEKEKLFYKQMIFSQIYCSRS